MVREAVVSTEVRCWIDLSEATLQDNLSDTDWESGYAPIQLLQHTQVYGGTDELHSNSGQQYHLCVDCG